VQDYINEMAEKHVHLIGIGGTGLSAIARLLMERGYRVSGSDRQDSPFLQQLRQAGARIYLGHASENIRGAQIIVRSSAISDDNPEVQAAKQKGIPVFKRVDFLGQLTAGSKTIAVAGTHGKTTTTAMLAWLLTSLGLDPSFIVGSMLVNLGTNAHAGQGAYFVIEADEYDRMFLGLDPYIAVVTNIEHDHPDCYPTPEEFFQAFREFADRLVPDGSLMVCADDPAALRLGRELVDRRLITYGLSAGQADYLAENLRLNQSGGFDFQVTRPTALPERSNGRTGLKVSLQIPGRHNVQNALAALAVADLIGLSLAAAAAALAEFRGAGRRFEVRSELAGVTVVDDYAHHPTEIRATLAAARARYPGRAIWVVWQPHTYSRTRLLQAEFAASFGDASGSPVEHVIVTEIYPARESAPVDGFSSRQVCERIRHPHVTFAPDLDWAGRFLIDHLQAGDVLLVLSAGDADQLSRKVVQSLQERTQGAQAGRQ
jgi:UDP-N-acetylmuramate--alanine ligase